jgi:hypothetical protein
MARAIRLDCYVRNDESIFTSFQPHGAKYRKPIPRPELLKA